MSILDQVSRVAALSSTIVINQGLPPRAQAASNNGDLTKAQVIDLSSNADAGPLLSQHASQGQLVTLTLADSSPLINLLPVLPALSNSPLVINVAYVNLAEALAPRSIVPFILHSSSPQQVYDHALLASRLASFSGRSVLHLFPSQTPASPIERLDDDAIVAIAKQTNSDQVASLTDLENYDAAAVATSAAIGRNLQPLSFTGAAESAPQTAFVTLGAQTAIRDAVLSDPALYLVEVSLLRPFPVAPFVQRISASVTKVIVLEPIYKQPIKWTPLYLDVVGALQDREPRLTVRSAVLGTLPASSNDVAVSLSKLSDDIEQQPPTSARPVLGQLPSSQGSSVSSTISVPKHESSYTKLLDHLFHDRLEILNHPSLTSQLGDVATRPEFALGRARALVADRDSLTEAVNGLLDAAGSSAVVSKELHASLTKWLANKDDPTLSEKAGKDIVGSLEAHPLAHPATTRILELKQHFPATSRWIIGSDAWSYDLGASGLHHLISSSLNVNILLIDNTPYSTRSEVDPSKRKKDAGLYAMNYGEVFVGSIAVYSSYSQSLQALLEADKFRGPSVVLAYLPYETEDTPALSVLKETKLAIDTGYWPLYRWNPTREDEPFFLESEAVKADLQDFLDRQNHLSQLTKSRPELATELVSSLGTKLQEARKGKAKQAYADLLNSMEGPPLLVVFASDGGNAEKVAKRLVNRAKARGVAARLAVMDSVPLEELKQEQYVAFVTSTAGQGEPPQNGRDTFRSLNAAATRGDRLLAGTTMKYSVFAMGDSHYWPRPEDAGYYNKPGKDLDARLELLGAERMAGLGLGDDQDADGPQTGYKLWEPTLWKALGVDSVEVLEAEPEPITNENIKIASNYLRGTIAEGLKDTSTGALAASDGQLTKFHGIYEQDDRDIRDERKDAGLEPAYSFMIRVRMPGGVCDPKQWLAMDRIADERGNGTFKLTTRQTFQFHGVIKKHLKPAIQGINKALLDTIAACGDVNRNVLCSSLPDLSHLHSQVYDYSKRISEHLLPQTTAYHEIWLDKKLVAGDAVKDHEPLYGAYYLPRKFKVAIAVPPTNDVDIFANDVGFIAIADDKGNLSGFNVTAGGGMGVTHSNKKTYPRTGDVLGFCTPDQAHIVAEKIMLTQRDNGNRSDRKNARLKYTIDRMGLDNFKADVEKRLGWQLAPARPFEFTSNIDKFGWTTGYNGKHHFTMFIENGRVQDEPGKEFKTGLQEIAKVHRGNFRLTANQHLVLADVDDADLPEMKRLLSKYGLDNLSYSGLRLSSSACVSFPTCGLAMAESERYLPILIDKVEAICEEHGLRNDSIVMRMTGCPNGCARPYIAEVAFVGKAPGSYLMLLGGGYHGQRLNKIYRENVTEPEILAILRPMIKRYALERHEGEHFGDFVIRAGYISATKSGKEWYDGMGGEGENRARS
ncbi:hypothetical protein M407DRAFT_233226 [Tulasnella calospora MUT 4182]|uniref:assimilatory sulfite reductase (NADPH) n=1 Tax=Tulasnella calospora MUT 4182 TaxID=1051891 RepID=A0A0C3L0P8_9AGAM|nr:hypothetical protein M407DRAFT_233226 [Tulasnella calospora MUT 4182]